LAYQYSHSAFDDTIQPTVGASFVAIKRQVLGQEVTIHLWDTAGQERFRCLAPIYFREADIALLVYDVTNQESYSAVKDDSWFLKEIQRISPGCSIVVVGNKIDAIEGLEMDSEREMARQHAKKKGWAFFESSAKENINVTEIFNEVLRIVSQHPDFGQ